MRHTSKVIVAASLVFQTLCAPSYAQDDAKSEFAKLRAELAKLREEIKELKDLVAATKGEGPMYRGKPATHWLVRLDDADPAFRAEALDAIAKLVSRNRELIEQLKLVPRMIQILNDKEAGYHAGDVLAIIGADAVPALTEVIKEKRAERRTARIAAIHTVGMIGPKAKSAVPALISALEDRNDRDLLLAAVMALGSIQTEAKSALPALAARMKSELFEPKSDKLLQLVDSNTAYAILAAMAAIEPDLIDSYPQQAVKVERSGPAPKPRPNLPLVDFDGFLTTRDARLLGFQEAERRWRQMLADLEKKYPLSK